MDKILERLGTYRALNAATVQFNSVVFRVVVGFLAGIPAHIVATIPAIEFVINFLLEIPTGRLADRFGRIPLAIIGHIAVILGLSCGYVALNIHSVNPELAYTLFILHGVFIGFNKPLTSGSVEAFYQDALHRCEDRNEDLLYKSMTISKKYGKYLTTVAIVLSFASIFVMKESIGAHHAFVIGIILWALTLLKLYQDYSHLGDVTNEPTKINSILKMIVTSRRSWISIFYSTSAFTLIGLVMGYFIVAIGREETGHLRWTLIIAFMLSSQGLGWIVKSHILPNLINKISEKNYLSIFYLSLSLLGILLYYFFRNLNPFLLIVFISILGITFMTAVSAISSVAHNIIMSEVKKDDFAFAISVQSMPGYLVISLMSYIFSIYFDGTPSTEGIVLTMSVLSGGFFLGHIFIYREKIATEALI